MMQKDRTKIIVVEDDEDLLEILCDLLTEEGYKVIKARNVKDFRRANKKENFNLAILDVKLPDGDGSVLAEQLKSQNNDVKVILCSAWGNLDKLALKVKADDYIKKPFEFEGLLSRVERLAG